MTDLGRRLNVGCGATPTPGWRNFDNSISARLGRLPNPKLVATGLRRLRLVDPAQAELIGAARDLGIEYADATKAIPAADASVEVLYSSHMLEHLTREGARSFLAEARRVLVSGGIIRVVVPDLSLLVDDYVQTRDADRFMARSLLSAERGPGLAARLKAFIVGDRHHQWLYDGPSLVRLLLELGFVQAELVPAGETRIPDPGPLDLRERSEESVYVEAMKP